MPGRLGVLLVLLLGSSVWAQNPNFNEKAAKKEVFARFEPASAGPGVTVTLKVGVLLNDGWHTYPFKQADKAAASQQNRSTIVANPLLILGKLIDPPGKTKPEPLLSIESLTYYPNGTTWDQSVTVSPDAKPGTLTLDVSVRVLMCDKDNCLPPKTYKFSPTIEVLDEPPIRAAIPTAKESPAVVPVEPKAEETRVGIKIPADADYDADIARLREILPSATIEKTSLLPFLLTAMFWGIVTLFTPCVFPMIPITVSYFLKQGQPKKDDPDGINVQNPLKLAAIYTLTIVVVLGLSAVTLLSLFRTLSVNPWMNVALGVLFVTFALSLFGMFELVLPSWMLNFTSSRQRSGGVAGTIFMACSFSIVSFTCVAPFLGGFSGMAASGNFSQFELVLGGLAFATAFAAPFFLLALFPAMLRKLPKSGSWMDTFKAVMGFLELAAALKFLRTAELRWVDVPQVFTYDMVLSIWIVLLIVCGVYLLNQFRLPHDEPQERIGVMRLMFAIGCLSFAAYLAPALFGNGRGEKNRPNGIVYAWVDAFLLPEPSAAELIGNELPWSADLLRSIEAAKAGRQLVFIDFTGVTCTNCKLNEKTVFRNEAVKSLMQRYRLVQMYADTVPEVFYEVPPDVDVRDAHASKNIKLQLDFFKSEQLPLYVILRPEASGRVSLVGIYREGKINDQDAFVRFLKDPLK